MYYHANRLLTHRWGVSPDWSRPKGKKVIINIFSLRMPGNPENLIQFKQISVYIYMNLSRE